MVGGSPAFTSSCCHGGHWKLPQTKSGLGHPLEKEMCFPQGAQALPLMGPPCHPSASCTPPLQHAAHRQRAAHRQHTHCLCFSLHLTPQPATLLPGVHPSTHVHTCGASPPAPEGSFCVLPFVFLTPTSPDHCPRARDHGSSCSQTLNEPENIYREKPPH